MQHTLHVHRIHGKGATGSVGVAARSLPFVVQCQCSGPRGAVGAQLPAGVFVDP